MKQQPINKGKLLCLLKCNSLKDETAFYKASIISSLEVGYSKIQNIANSHLYKDLPNKACQFVKISFYVITVLTRSLFHDHRKQLLRVIFFLNPKFSCFGCIARFVLEPVENPGSMVNHNRAIVGYHDQGSN